MSDNNDDRNKEQVHSMIDSLENPDIEETDELEEEEIETPEEEEEIEEDEIEEDDDLDEKEEEDDDFDDDLDDLEEDLEKDELKDEVKELRKTVELLLKKQNGETVDDEDSDDFKLEDVELDFISEEEFETIFENRESFNKILMKVFNQGREFTLREGSKVTAQKVIRQQTIEQKARDFYTNNPGLLKHKEYVGIIANKVAAKFPDKNIDFIYEKTAEIAKKRLNIKNKAEETEAERKKKSKKGFAKKSSRSPNRKSKEKNTETSFEKEQVNQIDSMLDSIK